MKVISRGKPYWKVRNWKLIENGNNYWYYGFYTAKGTSMNGRIIERPTLSSLVKKRIVVYLKNPPNWLKNHEKRRCMWEVGEKGWSRVHFQKNHPRTVDQAILTVEAFLEENKPSNV